MFGPDYIPRYENPFATIYQDCGHRMRSGELIGRINGRSLCGACCDAAEKARTGGPMTGEAR
ncbi:hypothetical protein DEJ49_33335 [Streptomyces venezuelae]|uniref:Uncharacterized protein n=1 Tax=Streptomyces venezuelae TaxID=54571 RepID=A0A5P2CQU6_STRVZ|nr:hypothetical protein DEJ49_33335 [Streptomyces venezuelae]